MLTFPAGARLAQRMDRARGFLLSALGSDDVALETESAVDDAAALLNRFSRAATEGAEAHNLELVARAVVTLVKRGEETASQFLPLADVLAVVTPEEMALVAALYEYVNDCGDLLRDRSKRCASAERRAIEALVPSVFDSEDAFRATAASLVRTGLVEIVIVYGNVLYAPAALAGRLNQIIPLGDCASRDSEQGAVSSAAAG